VGGNSIKRTESVNRGNDIGKTEPVIRGGDIGKTEPVVRGGDIGKTEPVVRGGDIGKTEPVIRGGDIGKTEPVIRGGDIGKTEPVIRGGDIGKTEPVIRVTSPVLDRRPPVSAFVNSDKTVPVIYSDVDKSFPVGFMVCIAGSIRGKDYKLRSGDNTIGRDPEFRKFDININDDNNVSRESPIIINYDPDTNEFTLSGGNSAQAVVKRNNKPVMPKTSVILTPYDKILIGKTKFMFLPLCGDDFIWDD
jgi:hypothetical protein